MEEEGEGEEISFNSDTSKWDLSDDDADTGNGWVCNIEDLDYDDFSWSDESSQHGDSEEEMKHDSIADSLDIGLSVSITSSNSESHVITDPSQIEDMVETVPAGQEKVESQLVKNDPILGWKSPGWLVREADFGADVMEKVTTDIVNNQVPLCSSSRLWSTASKYVLSPCSTVMAAVVIALVVSYLVFVSFLMVEIIYHFL